MRFRVDLSDALSDLISASAGDSPTARDAYDTEDLPCELAIVSALFDPWFTSQRGWVVRAALGPEHRVIAISHGGMTWTRASGLLSVPTSRSGASSDGNGTPYPSAGQAFVTRFDQPASDCA